MLLGGGAGQHAAAQRLHHDDGQPVLSGQLQLELGVLEAVVDVVELDLHELHLIAVLLEEGLHHVVVPVDRKAQVADRALVAQPSEVGHVAVGAVLVEVGVDVHLADVVHQVEVEAVHLAALQLLGEDLLMPAPVGAVVAGELVCQEEALARVLGQAAAHDLLRDAVVVAPGGVEVVHALLDGQVDHLLDGCLVHGGVV